ncbi:MAG: hypothetical protein HC836_48620 [Richelia sp. RM2_1_2]|nr:hypothetical protein [Richelia sp. RM2_1_2]
MANTSIIMLGNTGGKFEVIGEPIRADGFYGFPDGKHTISIHLDNFTGKVWLEGTLASKPRDGDCTEQYGFTTDWFSIYLTPCTPYLQFEQETSSNGYVFEGNFVYLRVRLDRSYIQPVPDNHFDLATLGTIRKVLLNH